MALTMIGTQAPQKLFAGVPAEESQIPGIVTPNITASMPSYADLEGIINAQNAQKAQSRASWARAAAINNARAAQANAGGNQEHYLPGTASQTSGFGYGQSPNNQGPVLWAPRNLEGSKLGTWTNQQQNKAIAENREMPTVLQAHTGDPWSPGEVGGGGTANVLGRGIYGPGLTSTLGTPHPAIWAKLWGGGAGSGGRTSQGVPVDPFPTKSLSERTRSSRERPSSGSGAQYQYDLFGGR